MARIYSMARFKEEIEEPKVVKRCEECDAELYEGDEVLQVHDDTFCTEDCFHEYYNIQWVNLDA